MHSVFFAVMLVIGSAFARDKSDGCGLGWQVTKKKTLSATTTRGSTNSVVPPTFGMSTGTIGCSQHSLVLNHKKSIHYVEVNYDQIMTEIAQGKGETLQTLAHIIGADKNFASRAKSNFSQFQNSNPSQLLEQLNQLK